MRGAGLRAPGIIVAVAALLAWTGGPAVAATPAQGAGDPYYPLQGNGGYDVQHYGLTLHYDTASGRLRARAAVRATATETMSVFDLDLRRNLRVSSVRVDGRRAGFRQPAALGQELVVRPATAVTQGARFTVVVRYHGHPKEVRDPDGSIEGWVRTRDGAFVVGEPQGSPAWFPCNDTPRDKATYDVAVTVPPGVTAISNGELSSRTRHRNGWRTFRWHNGRPMATYLATVTTGRFRVHTGKSPAGVPYYLATDPSTTKASRAVLGKIPEMTDYFTGLFGPYPFGSTGAVVDHAPKVGYALENQTKPLFDSPPDALTAAHEIAHMWFGDSVTLSTWRDIWVNEGFAEFASWMWSEDSGGRSAAYFFRTSYAQPAGSSVWNPPPADPGGPADVFDDSVYTRGAMTLQALRVRLGDPTFFGLLRAWYATHAYGNVTVEDFTAFASSYAGQDLSAFFDVWLYQKGKPTSW